jgi:hypothetical protein
MALTRTHDPRSRYIAFAVVVALHLLLLQIAQRISGVALRLEDEADDALVWLRLDPPPRPVERRPTDEPRREPQVDVRAPAPTPETPQPTQAPTTALPPRQIDWRANAARSAQLAVEAAGQERYRSFGPRKAPPPGEPQSPAVFAEPPKHKYGDIDEVGGDPVVWMNDNCYTELDKRVQTARDWVAANPGQFSSSQIRCVGGAGSAAADGKLFEHIKKREEPPVPKAGTEMNELPERKEEPHDQETTKKH